jgi:hypothetical protein
VQKFHFKGEYSQRLGRLAEHEGKKEKQEFKNLREWGFRFSGLLDEGRSIGGLLEVSEFFTECQVDLAQIYLAERVQLRASAALKTEIRQIK